MASNGKETLVLLATLTLTAGLAAGGFWFFARNAPDRESVSTSPTATPTTAPTTAAANPAEPAPPPEATAEPTADSLAAIDTSLPDPPVLTIDGSVTLVALVKGLQNTYAQVNPNLPTTYGVPDGKPNGTNQGLRNLIDGKVAMAASSRPLKPAEAQAGVQVVPIARDALAVMVGVNNPYKGGLTLAQLKQIFQGKITNWSQVGGPNLPMRVLNRSPDSGTATFFQDVVLLGEAFAPNGSNFKTFTQDVTTPIIRELGNNGISYTTVAQAVGQKTVRIVPIDGVSPTDRSAVASGQYPISRLMYLAYPKRTSPAVKQFIAAALSPQGQQVVARTGYIPLR